MDVQTERQTSGHKMSCLVSTLIAGGDVASTQQQWKQFTREQVSVSGVDRRRYRLYHVASKSSGWETGKCQVYSEVGKVVEVMVQRRAVSRQQQVRKCILKSCEQKQAAKRKLRPTIDTNIDKKNHITGNGRQRTKDEKNNFGEPSLRTDQMKSHSDASAHTHTHAHTHPDAQLLCTVNVQVRKSIKCN